MTDKCRFLVYRVLNLSDSHDKNYYSLNQNDCLHRLIMAFARDRGAIKTKSLSLHSRCDIAFIYTLYRADPHTHQHSTIIAVKIIKCSRKTEKN